MWLLSSQLRIIDVTHISPALFDWPYRTLCLCVCVCSCNFLDVLKTDPWLFFFFFFCSFNNSKFIVMMLYCPNHKNYHFVSNELSKLALIFSWGFLLWFATLFFSLSLFAVSKNEPEQQQCWNVSRQDWERNLGCQQKPLTLFDFCQKQIRKLFGQQCT